MDKIDEFVKSEKDVMYLNEPDRKKREKIHQYIKDNYKNTHISRTKYMSYGAKRLCCGKWYKSSNYGKSWNGGSVFCDVCSNYYFLDFDDADDIDNRQVKLSNYRPTEDMMICKTNFSYKRGYNSPFSYRKHY